MKRLKVKVSFGNSGLWHDIRGGGGGGEESSLNI
jgi:hypothetical protein